MNIAVKGSTERIKELNKIFALAGLSFTRVENTKNIHLASYNIIFDLNFDDDQRSLPDYQLLNKDVKLLLSSVKIQLEAVFPQDLWNQIIGINALSSFLSRQDLEYCTINSRPEDKLLLQLGWKNAYICASRVGLVSPRVICMIINEAYFTLQEGTANKNDINLGMKLGTAYPFGPFEWCEMIGIKDVYETLSVLYEDTHDERYKICSMLKTDYLKYQAQ